MGDERTAQDDDRGHGTRDRILIAAATMLGEDPTARLSVRGVAARAGVSTGSLRHFFPTQQALLDTVIASVYDIEVPGDPIHDRSRPPEARLIACLQGMLAEVGTGERAREQWRRLHEAYIASPPTEDAVAAYTAIENLGVHRIERWLLTLAEEGAASAVDAGRHARFLSTVIDGLCTQRALPSVAERFEAEAETLRTAVAAVTHPVHQGGGA